MQRARICWAMAGVAALCACGGTLASVRLQPEDPATLHVGQIVAVHVPSERHYPIGAAGSPLVLLKQKERQGTTIYCYRAAEIGDQTLVATPGGLDLGSALAVSRCTTSSKSFNRTMCLEESPNPLQPTSGADALGGFKRTVNAARG